MNEGVVALAAESGRRPTLNVAPDMLSPGPSAGNWKIAMKANNNKCLDVVGGGTANGTQVEIQDCDGTTAQAWTIAFRTVLASSSRPL